MTKMGFRQESKYIWTNGYYTYQINHGRLEYYKSEFNQLSSDTRSPKDIRNIMTDLNPFN